MGILMDTCSWADSGRLSGSWNVSSIRVVGYWLSETQVHLDSALECAYMEKEVWQKLDKYIEQTITIINGYIKFLEI